MSESRKRIRELGISVGDLQPGKANTITDVPGVRVGHQSIIRGEPSDQNCVRTGVTIIDPDHSRDVFATPVTGGTHVLNGYGKSVGFPQVDELGKIETPLGLTNTLSTWDVADGIVSHILETHEDATSVNPVVGECNDGVLNDIRGRHVSAENIQDAFNALNGDGTDEGCVGAGVGTTGFGWKAGIGTASRSCGKHTVGALVLTNTGKPNDLRIDGLHINRFVEEKTEATSAGGSIMMIVGTDASLSGRQLNRVLKRTSLGLGRVGGIAHHGSGDFSIGFANGRAGDLTDSELTLIFRGVIEATEEAIYNSLTCARTMKGINGKTVEAIPIDAIKRAANTRGATSDGSD